MLIEMNMITRTVHKRRDEHKFEFFILFLCRQFLRVAIGKKSPTSINIDPSHPSRSSQIESHIASQKKCLFYDSFFLI